jgi:hypothetical protein
MLKVRKTHLAIQFPFGCTDVVEDLPGIVERVAGPERPDSAVLGQRGQDQNMPRVQQEDRVVEPMWEMLSLLVL